MRPLAPLGSGKLYTTQTEYSQTPEVSQIGQVWLFGQPDVEFQKTPSGLPLRFL
jgi:hypothetical protein